MILMSEAVEPPRLDRFFPHHDHELVSLIEVRLGIPIGLRSFDRGVRQVLKATTKLLSPLILNSTPCSRAGRLKHEHTIA